MQHTALQLNKKRSGAKMTIMSMTVRPSFPSNKQILID